MVKLLYFELGNTYHALADYSSADAAVEWLQSNLRGNYVIFNDTSLPAHPQNIIRNDQWVIIDDTGALVPMKYEGGKFTLTGAV